MPSYFPLDQRLLVWERVSVAVNSAMDFYAKKLAGGQLEYGLEASFKFDFGLILKSLLDLDTTKPNEGYRLIYEQNFPFGGRNDYVDLTIAYNDGSKTLYFPIEFKNRKETDSADNLGVVASYKDMANLDTLVRLSSNMGGGFFIFLTNLGTYRSHPTNKGTRAELPMYDGTLIEADHPYRASGKTARNTMKEFPHGFVFSSPHQIHYHTFQVSGHSYWFFIVPFYLKPKDA